MSSLASSPAVRAERHFDSVTFCKEFELLLACWSVDGQQCCSLVVSACSGAAVAWELVLRLARHHGVVPLLYQSVGGWSRDVPAAILDDLRRRYEDNARPDLKF